MMGSGQGTIVSVVGTVPPELAGFCSGTRIVASGDVGEDESVDDGVVAQVIDAGFDEDPVSVLVLDAELEASYALVGGVESRREPLPIVGVDQRGGARTDEFGAAATEHPIGGGADVLQVAVPADQGEHVSGLAEEGVGSRLVAVHAGAHLFERPAGATFVEPEGCSGDEHAAEESGCEREPRLRAHIGTGIGTRGRRPEG